MVDNQVVAEEAAKAARRAYYRKWRAANPERVQESQRRYWLRKAAQMQKEETRAAVVATDPGQPETVQDSN